MTTESASHGQVSADAAEVYDSFFVPALFAQWTEVVLDAAGVRTGCSVVDVGCGTGTTARAAAERVGSSGSVVGVDINPGMLSVARRTDSRVTWTLAPAEQLPVPEESFDAALCQFVLMFVDDPDTVAAELYRVLRPGGRLAVTTWAGLSHSPGYAALAELVEAVAGVDAAEALRAPFRLGRTEQLSRALGSRFPDVDLRLVAGRARFASLDTWIHTDVRGWTLAELLDDAAEAALLRAARERLSPFVTADGRVDFPAPALVATALRPPD